LRADGIEESSRMFRIQPFLSIAALFAVGSVASPQPPQQESVTHLVADARAAIARIRDYSGTLVKQERINGQLQPEQFIDMRVRQQPFSVALKWTAPKQFVGQEAYFVLGKNNNEMKAKGTGLASIAGLVSMPPNDPRALKHSRHSITETGIGNLIETIARSNDLERRLPASQVKVTFADYAFQQRPCTRMEAIHLVNNGQFYCHRCVVYFDKETKLPIRMEAYDWPTAGGNTSGELIECYSYINLKFNVGLNDAVFGF
jgi:outer membrane lipoprotein-sorting protein